MNRSLYATLKEAGLEIQPRAILYYQTLSGNAPFREWYDALGDIDAQVAVRARLARLRRGLFGDCKPVGDGVYELRIFIGPGYRLYMGLKQRRWIILLCGGDKSSQRHDVETAKLYWADYVRRSVL